MTGFKIYYEKATGNVVLTIPENPSAEPTTKEQDFSMYSVLQARIQETVDFIQLEFGQYQSEFHSARSWKVDQVPLLWREAVQKLIDADK